MAAYRNKKRESFGEKSNRKKWHQQDDDSEEKGSGRIGRLDDDTMGYYRRVLETLNEGFSDKTEQEQFLSNVFASIEKEELKVSQNQTVSHILEKLLGIATGKQLCGFLQGLSNAEDVCTAAKDRFAAHVLQTALLQAVTHINDTDCGQEVQTVLLAVCKEIITKLPEFINHTYAAHVLSAVIEVLAGVKVPEQVTRSRLSQGQMHAKDHGRDPKMLLKETPARFHEELTTITHMVMGVDSIIDLLLNEVASPVVAVLLLVLKTSEPDLCSSLSKVIIKACKLETKQLKEDTVPVMLSHPIASHVMEVLVQAAPEKQFNKLYSSCIQGRCKQLALNSTANYVLQRVITRAAHTNVFEELFTEMSKCIEDIMAVNHMGVIIRLAESCVQCPAQQGLLMIALMKAFHCYEPKERQPSCVPLMASLTTYDVYFGEEEKEGGDDDAAASESKPKGSKKSLTINFHGSLLLQQLLKFKNCGSVSAGFLALTPDDLVAMSCDSAGSFLLEAFMASGASDKKKDKLIEKLKGNCVKIACTRNGSRAVDSIFAAASMRSKFNIVEELAKKDAQLAGDQYGRHVHRNCALNHFKYRRGQWKELQGRETKKRKLFAEIIGEEGGETKKKKKPKKADDVYFKEMVVLGMVKEDDMDADDLVGSSQDGDDEIHDIFNQIDKSQPNSDKSKPMKKHSKSHNQSAAMAELDADTRTSYQEEKQKSGDFSKGKKKKKKKKASGS